MIVADLHVHSKYSRATSRNLELCALHRAALEKGVTVVGTGDFTHPGWRQQIEAELEPAEDGLLRLRPELRRAAEQGLPRACRGEVRFMLQVEISNIYKKAGRTRKNHNLVFVPTLEAAQRFSEKLGAIGNLTSDGRPILGLDARDLLEITLESDPLAFLVPAHVWTPWFSMLGSQSGFDSIDECFGDLARHIFAVETGLSSDPPMNWRLSQLDRVALVSNSDAHSPAKLGREANLFDTELGYVPLRTALRTRDGFAGTLEFFPEEGKYHLDGHRKCGVRLSPEQTRELGGRCPSCGEKVTVGVYSRVLDLADRPTGKRPEKSAGFVSLVPLGEVAAEVCGTGAQSKKTAVLLERLRNTLGPELFVLREASVDQIQRVAGAPLAEAVRRMRAGDVRVEPGYDGEYGTVRLFDPNERDHLVGQMVFVGGDTGKPVPAKLPTDAPSKPELRFEPAAAAPPRQNGPCSEAEAPATTLDLFPSETGVPALAGLDPEQTRAASILEGPLLIVAGPGTGKTRTLVARIAGLIEMGRLVPEQALAITFTNQAALELRERLMRAVPGSSTQAPLVTTFHGLGLCLLREFSKEPFEVADDEQRVELVKMALGDGARRRPTEQALERISLAKQSPDPRSLLAAEPELVAVFERYEQNLRARGLRDVDDLVLATVELLRDSPEITARVCERFASISVDEYQDVNDVQAALVRLLSPDGKRLCVIGDPDQAIYGFRGAAPGHFARFTELFPGAEVVTLRRSYRVPRPLLAAAQSVLKEERELDSVRDGLPLEVIACPSVKSEAEQVLVRIERIVGGTSTFAVDSGRAREAEALDVGFGDIAVLTRTKAQHAELVQALERSGIPCRVVGEDEPHDPRSQKVAIMTLHASKGREFEVVFLTGAEHGLLPLQAAGLVSDPEEERRLLYVGMTRAKRLCIVSHAKKRTLFGKALPGVPSPFLAKLPEGAVCRTSAVLPVRRPASRQLGLFD
jgi:DNA helicase-2/ATP-dependent DNA helicase PcrA